MQPKIILFDIDGTLIRTGGGGKRALHDALAALFAIKNPDVEVDFAGRTDLSITHELFALNGIELTEERVKSFLGAYQTNLPAAIKERPSDILPGVAELLSRLKLRSDIYLGLLTGNIESGAYTKLAHHELGGFFAFGGFGDKALQRTAIASLAFDAARCFVGPTSVDPHRVLVIGDTPHDIACAKHIGARSLAVATGTIPRGVLADAGPDYLLDNLLNTEEVMTIIDHF